VRGELYTEFWWGYLRERPLGRPWGRWEDIGGMWGLGLD